MLCHQQILVQRLLCAKHWVLCLQGMQRSQKHRDNLPSRDLQSDLNLDLNTEKLLTKLSNSSGKLQLFGALEAINY